MLEINLDPKKSSDAHLFEDKDKNTTELVHKMEFDLVNEWINARLNSLTNSQNADKKDKERLHDTITILGTRGSGKTSFLLNVLKKNKNPEVAVLDIIDPTLIEEKGHVFLNIISMIKDAVDSKLDKDSCNPKEPQYQSAVQWRKLIEDLAHGLPSIDGVGGELTDSSWQDPAYIMQRGLRSVSAARELEGNFNMLVDFGLKTLNKKAFLIAFDDIDIDFKKGWPVLETIRKYITSPRIITLLSGDMRLYSYAIRKQQWGNFGKALLINEGQQLEKLNYFNDLVTEYESQYLQKVLKPERRIYLTTLNEKVNTRDYRENPRNGDNDSADPKNPTGTFPVKGPDNSPVDKPDRSFTIQIKTEKEVIEIKKFYNKILFGYGIANSYQAEAYRSFLLSLPLRTQIRFLSAYEPLEEGLKNSNITDVFLSNLLEKKVDVDLAHSNPKFLNVIILELLLRGKMLDEAYQLQPTTTDANLNCSITALSFLFSRNIANNNPYLVFDYFIKIGYIRNLLSSLGYRQDREGETISQAIPSIEGLCKHSAIMKDKVLRDITGLVTAYMVAYLKDHNEGNSSWGGIIELKGLAQSAKKGGLVDRIDTVFKEGSTIAKTLAYIPLSVCKYPAKQQSIVVYSVYTLLATIGEMIRKVKEKDSKKGLLELSQMRTYPMPDFGRTISSTIEAPSDETSSEKENEKQANEASKNDGFFKFNYFTDKWVNRFPGKAVSPHLLGKIATRMFYAFDSIQEGEKLDNLAQAMHFRIIAFMNAILIEDVKENLNDVGKLNINNTNYSEKIFLDNLKTITRYTNTVTFSQWMLSCPLLLCYLKPEKNIQEMITSFCGYYFLNGCFEISIYPLLEKVSLKEGGSETSISNSKPQTKRAEQHKKYVDLIKELTKIRPPLEWFQMKGTSLNKVNNTKIRKNLPPKIVQEYFDTWIKINRFRDFVSKNDIRW